MTWQPLWNEGPLISAHAVITLLAMAVGAIQLAAPKGTWCHRRLGFVWVGAMASVACPSSDNLGRLGVIPIGDSGSSLFEFMRVRFYGASAA